MTAQEQPDPAPMVRGISYTDFQIWKHHPVSKLFLQFVTDYRSQLIQRAVGKWEAGSLCLTEEQEMRGRAVACKEMAELQFEDIRSFYEGEKTNAAETT